MAMGLSVQVYINGLSSTSAALQSLYIPQRTRSFAPCPSRQFALIGIDYRLKDYHNLLIFHNNSRLRKTCDFNHMVFLTSIINNTLQPGSNSITDPISTALRTYSSRHITNNYNTKTKINSKRYSSLSLTSSTQLTAA